MAKLKVKWGTTANVQIGFRYVGLGETEWFSSNPYWHISNRSRLMKILTQTVGWKNLGTFGGRTEMTTTALNPMREFALRIRAQEGDKWGDWQYYAPELYAKPEYTPGAVSDVKFTREGTSNVKIEWKYDDMPGSPSQIIRFHIQRKALIGWDDVAIKGVPTTGAGVIAFNHIAPIVHSANLRFRIRAINKWGLHGPWTEMVDDDDAASTFKEFEALKKRVKEIEDDIKANQEHLDWLQNNRKWLLSRRGLLTPLDMKGPGGIAAQRDQRVRFLKQHQKTDLKLNRLDNDINDLFVSMRIVTLTTEKKNIAVIWVLANVPYLQNRMNTQLLDYLALPPL